MIASKRILALAIIAALADAATTIRYGTKAQDGAQAAKPFTIQVTGSVESPRSWTPDEMKSLSAVEIKNVPYTLNDQKREAHCLPLLALVQAAKLKISPKPKNHELALAIVVTGRDGYTACFSYGELQPQIGKRTVLVALDRDGKPLPDAAAPAEILSPDDEKPSRWVHAIKSINVIDCVQPDVNK